MLIELQYTVDHSIPADLEDCLDFCLLGHDTICVGCNKGLATFQKQPAASPPSLG
jgi:hypothetical protein